MGKAALIITTRLAQIVISGTAVASLLLLLLPLPAAAAAAAAAAATPVSFSNPVRSMQDDEVVQLPGLTAPINFKHYSGYVNVDEPTAIGTTATNEHFLHYWLVESRSGNATEQPLLLWLNGGPGCSSMLGFFTENGPFKIDAGGRSVSLREHSWNANANVVFLESPTGVGYSYNAKSKRELIDDNSTARQNYLAIKQLLRKFPHYANRSLYISGESYGGVYLPTLGVLLDADSTINFKGIAIGNGYLDAEKLGKTLIFYGYYHGLYGKTDFERLSEHCCDGKPPAYSSCSFAGTNCNGLLVEITKKLLESGVNPYNYAADCAHAPSGAAGKRVDSRAYTKRAVTRSLMQMSLDLVSPSTAQASNNTCSNSGARKKFSLLGDDGSLREEPPCDDDTTLIEYLDSAELRAAIHVPAELPHWAGPCASINYNMVYPQRVGGLTPQMQSLIDSKRKLAVLIYNGDLDMMCNFHGDELFAEDLKRKVSHKYSKWTVNDQVAGYYKSFKGFTFATVKGAGHMVPTDRPREALEMITRWLLV